MYWQKVHTLHRYCHGRRNFKDTNPLMSSSLVILFGVVKQFGRFWIWSETECKIPAEWKYLQSIKSVKHNAANSVNRSILKKSWHIGFGVFIVHSSMARVFIMLPKPCFFVVHKYSKNKSHLLPRKKLCIGTYRTLGFIYKQRVNQS